LRDIETLDVNAIIIEGDDEKARRFWKKKTKKL